MKRITGYLLCGMLLFAAVPGRAQTAPPAQPAATPAQGGIKILFKNGTIVSTTSLRLAGENVMATVQVGNGTGEIGYPLETIAKIDFPEPPQIATATALLEQGKDAAALAQLEPVVAYCQKFEDLPGNYWLPAARLKLKALVDLQQDQDAGALVADIVKASSDPEDSRIARMLIAENWARKGDDAKALAVYNEVIKTSTNDETLAHAWLNKGDSLLVLKEYNYALLAYLRLPVFYPDQKLLMPQAILGSVRAYIGIDDTTDAGKAAHDLVEQFPGSQEASIAEKEIQKITKNSAGGPVPAAGNP